MLTIADDGVRARLIARLRGVTPERQRRWGSLTAAEMLCHLGDTGESVLRRRIPPGPHPTGAPRPILKWLLLYSPLPWPKGARTRPGVNPHEDGTRPGDFERDRSRVIDGLDAIARTPREQLSEFHFLVGPMTLRDWHRWAYKHVDHHLRQFGV